MAVGARDQIDRMLVQRYQQEVTNKLDVEALSKEQYWEIMKEVAEVQRTMIEVATKVRQSLDNKKINSAKSQA